MIEGGFYLKARCIQNAEISHAPPHVREIWDWLLMKASYSDGTALQRGQVFVSYHMIIEALSWHVGWRKEHYSKSDCENAMKWLRKAAMVTTKKTTRGLIVTICKYEYYQDTKNYESHKERRRNDAGEPHYSKSSKEINKDIPPFFDAFWEAYPKRDGKKVDKAKCLKFFKTFKNGDRESVVESAKNYASVIGIKEGGKFVRDPIRFLKEEYWKDWLEKPKTQGESEWI